MGIFSSSKQTGKIIAVFNIGSGVVSGALVKIEKEHDKVPTLLATSIIDIAEDTDMSFESFLLRMHKALAHTARELAHKGNPSPKSIHCFLGSPWYTSVSRTITLEKKSSFVFSKDFERELIQKEINKIGIEMFTVNVSGGEAPVIIEQKILSTTLNGYIQTVPYDKQANIVSMSLFVSCIPKSVYASIREGILSGYTRSNIQFHSFAVAGSVVSRPILREESSFIFADIRKEISELSIIRDGAIVSSSSFPSGTGFVIRRIMSIHRCGANEAMRLFTLFNDKMLKDDIALQIKTILDKAEEDWQNSFRDTIISSTGQFFIPKTIILTTDELFVKWFKNAIENEPFHKYQCTEKSCVVTVLDKNSLLPYIKNAPNTVFNNFLMLEAIFVSINEHRVP